MSNDGRGVGHCLEGGPHADGAGRESGNPISVIGRLVAADD